ncbi:MAG: preprotein translocase subunit SecE [Clostridiales bacterium]|nr:preprotein translocase subunit SecE [Clostridiales bacterium]
MADAKEKKEKKKKEPGKVRRWFKDFFSELKKVTWPTFSKVVKNTGIVLLITVIFLLVLMLFDFALGEFHGYLIGNIPTNYAVAALKTFGGGGLL